MRGFSMILWVVAALACTTAGPRGGGDQQAGEEIKALGLKARDAVLQGDATVLAEIWAPEYTRTYPDGSVLTRDQRLAALQGAGAAPRLAAASENLENSVRVYGDAALQQVLVRLRYEGERQDSLSRVTTVWIRRGGRWQAVASHSSSVQAASPGDGGNR